MRSRSDGNIRRNTLGKWRWIKPELIYCLQRKQLAEHGGSEGVRDAGGIESAMARPINRANYGEPDAAELAAAYAYGFAKNHGFVDGNKRTGWVAARLFLRRNGYRLRFEKEDAIRTMEGVADSSIPEDELAAWFRERLSAG